MATVAAKRYTPEDLLTMEDGGRYELVDGELEELAVSAWSSYVGGQLHHRLCSHCEATGAGWPYPPDASFQCYPDAPDKVRKPDVAFIARNRMTVEQAQQEGHIRIVPDLVAEVLSPNDLAYKVAEKVQEYLDAGVHLVWVINPANRTVAVHRPTEPGTILRENDELTGEAVLPGFRCRVGDLFQPPPTSAAPAAPPG